jgi:hypothetical protein
MQAVVGQQSSFDQGRQELQLLAGFEVTTKAVERTAEAVGGDIAQRDQKEIDRALQLQLPLEIGPKVPILYILMDGTGVPVRKSETEGRQGKIPGQPARTREVKLGCVFTQTGLNEEGYPIRDVGSTTYVAAIETAERFGKRLYVEVWKRGWSQADKKVVIGDGAEWIWNIADQHFPGALQIVDLFHARQHLWDIARALHPLDQSAQQRWILRHQPKLDSGQIEKLTAYLDSQLADATPAQLEILRVETAYFDKNKDRMRYPEFRAQGLFIGSGVIEAGCRTLIGARLKQSGNLCVRMASPSSLVAGCGGEGGGKPRLPKDARVAAARQRTRHAERRGVGSRRRQASDNDGSRRVSAAMGNNEAGRSSGDRSRKTGCPYARARAA